MPRRRSSRATSATVDAGPAAARPEVDRAAADASSSSRRRSTSSGTSSATGPTGSRSRSPGSPRCCERGHVVRLGELDLHLAGEGRHERIYERLGAHVVDEGVSFAVWAPNARAVSRRRRLERLGRARRTRSSSLGSSGIWAAVVPEASEGDGYKFEVHGADGQLRLKADPFAFYAEVPPKTASEDLQVALRVGRQRLARAPARLAAAEGAALDLRGACGVVAAGPRLEGARRPARLLRRTSSASRTSSSCRSCTTRSPAPGAIR